MSPYKKFTQTEDPKFQSNTKKNGDHSQNDLCQCYIKFPPLLFYFLFTYELPFVLVVTSLPCFALGKRF